MKATLLRSGTSVPYSTACAVWLNEDQFALQCRPDQIGAHIALIEEAAGGTALAHDRAGDIDRLTIVTRDRPGILSLVAGTLAVHNVTVLGGTAFTREGSCSRMTTSLAYS